MSALVGLALGGIRSSEAAAGGQDDPVFSDDFEDFMPEIVIPAPTGGINARDPLAAMPVEDALEMVNMRSRGGYVESRPPMVNLGAPVTFNRVHTLIPYYGAATQSLIVGDDTDLVLMTGATPSTLGTGFTGKGWQWCTFDEKLIMVGGGTAQVYDGATLTALNITTGPDEDDLWGCVSFKGRMWYWERNKVSPWYCATGSYQGTLTEFPLDLVTSRGGYLVFIAPMSTDGNAEIANLLAFVYSSGEVLMYSGDDPGDAAAWSLVGQYQIGKPLGIRSWVRVGGDVVVMTRNSYVSLMATMRGKTGSGAAVSDKVRNKIPPLIKTYDDTEPIDSQSTAVYCAEWNSVLFLHNRDRSGIAPEDPESDMNAKLMCLNLENGTWYESLIWDGIHAITEFGGQLYAALRTNDGTVDFIRYSDPEGEEDTYFQVRQAFVPTKAPVQLSMGCLETNFVDLNTNKFHGFRIQKNFESLTDFYALAMGGYGGATVNEAWKTFSGLVRAWSVAWDSLVTLSDDGATPVRWYRTRMVVKPAQGH